MMRLIHDDMIFTRYIYWGLDILVISTACMAFRVSRTGQSKMASYTMAATAQFDLMLVFESHDLLRIILFALEEKGRNKSCFFK